jgi:hypothetical protein
MVFAESGDEGKKAGLDIASIVSSAVGEILSIRIDLCKLVWTMEGSVVCVAFAKRLPGELFFYGWIDTSERPKIEIHAKFY